MSLAHRAISALLALSPAPLGCSSAKPAPAPAPAAPPAPAPASADPEPAPVSELAPAPAVEPPADAPESEAAETDAPAEPASQVMAACAELCARASEQCSARSARKCRANCERYESLAERCGEATLAAIQCQAGTPGLVCSNVVGPCAAEFQRLNACESGQAPATADAPATPAPLPANWVRLTDEEAGFSVGLPKPGESQTEGGNRTWRVQDDTGVTYVVAVLPPFQGAVTDKLLVQKVLVILGHRCQREMKIHGRYQSNGREAVRFDSHCSSGESWHGMLRISDLHVIMTAEVVPPGKTGTGDPYYYSFTYL